MFYFAPSQKTNHSVNGLIKCRGVISVYAQKMPLMITGEIRGNVFYCSSCNMPKYNVDSNMRVLKYIDENLTESQQLKICELCGQDLTLLANLTKVNDIVSCFAKTSKSEKEKLYLANKIVNGLMTITSKDEMTSELIKFAIPADRIEILLAKKITMDDIKKNPYKIFVSNDIAIETADNFAKCYLDIEAYAPIRISGYIIYVLNVYLSQGNTCVKIEALVKYLNNVLEKSLYPEQKLSVSIIKYYFKFIQDIAVIKIISGEMYAYINTVYAEEQTCLENINRLTNDKKTLVKSIDISKYEELNGICYNDEQKKCTELLKESGVKILTGPPGSGKTALIKLLIQLYKEQFKGRKIRLAATTGRAAQVMKEACGMRAETVHKLLDLRMIDDMPAGKNLNNPIDASFIIVDEVSMLDLQMFSLLLSAVKTGSILLLVGDKDQLESVGYGNVLSDLITSGKIPTYSLNKVLRSNKNIFTNAQKVNNGNTFLEENDDFIIRNVSSINELRAALINDIDFSKENQVICPIKGSYIGVDELNIMLQHNLMKGSRPVIVYNKKLFYLNDKVIMLKNNYIKHYMNGDIGIIIDKAENEEKITVQFTDKTIDLTTEDFLYMDLAYAVTTHKSQGSGFDTVHIVLPSSAPIMLTRKMVYTAITRAKQKVYIYSIDNSLENAISNHNEKYRSTQLGNLLENQ